MERGAATSSWWRPYYAFANGIGARPYTIAKAGVEQLGRTLRAELSQRGASASVAYFGFIDAEMVRQTIDPDPLADRMMATFPKALHGRLPPDAARTVVASGIEHRAPRIVRPRLRLAVSELRGVLSPIVDARLQRNPEVQALPRELERRDASSV